MLPARRGARRRRAGKGAQARFELGPFQLQPGELAKLFVILVLAGYCELHRGDLDVRRLAVALVIAGVPIGLIMLQPDLGTDLVLMFIVFTMLAVAGIRGRHLVILLLLVRHGRDRGGQLRGAEGLPDRPADPFLERGQGRRDASEYNHEQSKIAIGTGGLTGAGPLRGHARRTARYVPEQHTDFIFTVVGEELGFVGGAIAARAVRADRVAHLANRPARQRLLRHARAASGVLAMFVFQVFENVGMTMGIMPITGIPLPVHELRRLLASSSRSPASASSPTSTCADSR